MSLRDSLQQTLRRFSGEMLPDAFENAGHRIDRLRKHLDNLNCSLAEKALPEDRKARVSELSLDHKARQAGQKAPKKNRENI
ncbi:hypothetical protein [Marinobacter orientalis]|uniref:Uncharacterized protein n=1 Tax=Marinobacter orientalis TaxID=1928859 RepID=A0A7Y0WTI9_9GAMM|nr:hypothetical protein [Marinobacter orientalis]NMT64750.1 hypothetical protein [Marinobacter orientalis]TGX48218.1 hypothetical protein DIT72_14845 [Marinobacter orientalis]